jgi:transposase InsO family protein
VAARFNRTLKEQFVYGRVFQNIQDVRLAVAAFLTNYNQQWLVGKLGYRCPAPARREYFQAIAA